MFQTPTGLPLTLASSFARNVQVWLCLSRILLVWGWGWGGGRESLLDSWLNHISLQQLRCEDTTSTCLVIQVQVQHCFTSTETIRTVRDGEPSMTTLTFTQLLSTDQLCIQHNNNDDDHNGDIRCACTLQKAQNDESTDDLTTLFFPEFILFFPQLLLWWMGFCNSHSECVAQGLLLGKIALCFSLGACTELM